MCGRMTLTRRELEEVASELEATLEPGAEGLYRARYNLAPTDPHFVVRLEEGAEHGAGRPRRVLGPALWGVPRPGRGEARGPAVINARAETVLARGMFRDAALHRRCIVPADGFYEWVETPHGKQPIWFHREDGGLLLMAGLWQGPGDGAGERAAGPGAGARRFVVITTTASGRVAPVHDRMPALLSPAQARAWLDAPARELLRPAPDDWLVATPVSRRVSSVKNDDPACLEPVAAAAGAGRQMDLF